MAMPRKTENGKGKVQKRVKVGEADAVLLSSASASSDKQTISIIGAGRLGTALAVGLGRRGYRIESLVARRLSHARRAAKLLDRQTLPLSSAQLENLPPSSIIFITTPDDAIEPVATQLAASLRWSGRGCVALHASGALSSEALNSLLAIGFQTGSMHPLISVSDPLMGAESLAQAHYCIEGQPPAVRLARRLARELGGHSFSIQTRDKALYHAAAVMASGHMVALFDIAAEMLTHCGLSEKGARDALLPLVASTLENLSRHAPARALTGTFARADVATVLKHLSALGGIKSRDALASYILLGRRSLELAKRNGAYVSALTEIARVLKDEAKDK